MIKFNQISFQLNVIPVSLYFMIIAELIELCYYCAIGTIVDHSVGSLNTFLKYNLIVRNKRYFQYERLYEELITSEWHLLPQSCKKDLILFLYMANRPSGVTIGEVLPLNMHTYLIVSLCNCLLIIL